MGELKSLLIEHSPHRVCTAYTVDGKLKEIYIDPTGEASLVGHIYVGRVQNILPGQFAFVDIGAGKNAFMNLEPHHRLKKGDAALLQIYKDADRTKGPYGGQKLKLKGHWVIVHESPRGEIGVSHKITDPAERSRLRGAVKGALEKGFGAIVRTHAENHAEEDIAAETRQLLALYHEITEKARYARPPVLLYPQGGDAPTGLAGVSCCLSGVTHEATSLLVDLLCDDMDEIWVAGGNFPEIKKAVAGIAPHLENRVFLYDEKDAPGLFDARGITSQMEKALEKTVQLPSGGYITFEQTEACVVIDVNTGAFSGTQNYRAAILQTNTEAAAAIAAQLMLRNLSGMIIVDFIDMKDLYDKNVLLDVLARELKKDRIKTEIVGMTELGLVQLTRRKTRPPLARLLETDCPHCGGSGRVKR